MLPMTLTCQGSKTDAPSILDVFVHQSAFSPRLVKHCQTTEAYGYHKELEAPVQHTDCHAVPNRFLLSIVRNPPSTLPVGR